MKPPKFLIDGYGRFRAGDGPTKIKTLAGGQAPSVMVIGCSDSRVHPATIFDADPGDLFMVRNVANIVPPFELGDGYHGTSSALEFAVKTLKIKHILVLGHSSCGGVAASLAHGEDHPVGDFIGPWVELMSPTRDAVSATYKDASPDQLQTHLEKAIAFYELMGFKLITDIGFDAGHPIIMQHSSGVVLNLLGPGTPHPERNVLMDIDVKYPGYTHRALRVGSLADARAFFVAQGIEITGSFTFKDLSAIFVRDPDGNVIEFDEYAGDEPETRKDAPGYSDHP